MKNIILLYLICLSFTAFGQKYYTKTGALDFEASVPAFEPVKAENATTTAVLDLSNGNIAVLALIKGFRFKNALMEEHFNENYMDSNTYPKAKFSGTLDGFSEADLGSEKTYMVKGDLTIHGKTKKVEVPVTLSKKGDAIVMSTTFSTSPEDFGIEIPSIVKEKISESINITGNFDLVKR